MSAHPTRFTSHLDLDTLPWFERRDGRLHMVDPDVGPIADVHTHLALTFARRRTVDLRTSPGHTQHYLGIESPVDLDVYANRNFSQAQLAEMTRDLGLRCVTRSGMRCTHTAPNLLGEMDELRITASVLLPIDLPYISWNAEEWLEVVRELRGLVSMGSVHPIERRMGERLEAQKAAGAVGVKVHPAVQLLPPDHPRCMALYGLCGELGLPVFWHCGPVDIETRLGRWCSQLKHYWRAIAENPSTTFVLGHSGALQWELALDLVHTYPNVWMEVASQGLPVVRRLLQDAPKDRLMFGTDWPFYHQGMGLAKVLIATDGSPADRSRILWDNAAGLFGLAVPR